MKSKLQEIFHQQIFHFFIFECIILWFFNIPRYWRLSCIRIIETQNCFVRILILVSLCHFDLLRSSNIGCTFILWRCFLSKGRFQNCFYFSYEWQVNFQQNTISKSENDKSCTDVDELWSRNRLDFFRMEGFLRVLDRS